MLFFSGFLLLGTTLWFNPPGRHLVCIKTMIRKIYFIKNKKKRVGHCNHF
ncbi:hypothetical protein RVIR1_06590 [Candidatus Rickettsiella viridis]|uniref:Uncharacterized protein n=1 Tax=Candidatus Rickettsiella viridis TaxID=676208 RepID=A0A2Z5V735_9COXI|nr:hypothetical protein RVIR1_06590 [Candidatus Rickettsiella viridis]